MCKLYKSKLKIVTLDDLTESGEDEILEDDDVCNIHEMDENGWCKNCGICIIKYAE